MQSYDVNIHWGTKTIKITFKMWDYTGYVTYRKNNTEYVTYRKNNTWHESPLRVDANDLYDRSFVDNNAQLMKYDTDCFSMVLKDKKGEELVIQEKWGDLSDFIVAVETIDVISEKEGLEEETTPLHKRILALLLR